MERATHSLCILLVLLSLQLLLIGLDLLHSAMRGWDNRKRRRVGDSSMRGLDSIQSSLLSYDIRNPALITPTTDPIVVDIL